MRRIIGDFLGVALAALLVRPTRRAEPEPQERPLDEPPPPRDDPPPGPSRFAPVVSFQRSPHPNAKPPMNGKREVERRLRQMQRKAEKDARK
jgi:hypothetical protein